MGTAPSTLKCTANEVGVNDFLRAGRRAAFGEKLEYKATGCPDVGGGRPGVSQGDFGSTEYIWLEKMLSLTGSSTEVAVCVSSVRASKSE